LISRRFSLASVIEQGYDDDSSLRASQLMLLDVVEFDRFSHTKKTIVSGAWVLCDSKNVEREKQADFVCDWVGRVSNRVCCWLLAP